MKTFLNTALHLSDDKVHEDFKKLLECFQKTDLVRELSEEALLALQNIQVFQPQRGIIFRIVKGIHMLHLGYEAYNTKREQLSQPAIKEAAFREETTITQFLQDYGNMLRFLLKQNWTYTYLRRSIPTLKSVLDGLQTFKTSNSWFAQFYDLLLEQHIPSLPATGCLHATKTSEQEYEVTLFQSKTAAMFGVSFFLSFYLSFCLFFFPFLSFCLFSLDLLDGSAGWVFLSLFLSFFLSFLPFYLFFLSFLSIFSCLYLSFSLSLFSLV